MFNKSVVSSIPLLPGKEGWLKAGVVGGYTMLIIMDLRIHLPPPPYGYSSFLKEESFRYCRLVSQPLIFVLFSTCFQYSTHPSPILFR